MIVTGGSTNVHQAHAKVHRVREIKAGAKTLSHFRVERDDALLVQDQVVGFQRNRRIILRGQVRDESVEFGTHLDLKNESLGATDGASVGTERDRHVSRRYGLTVGLHTIRS